MTAEPAEHDSQQTSTADKQEQCDPRLLEILVCPFTKTRLVYDKAANELVSRAAGLAFPIRNGVPLMTADAARTLSADEGGR